MNLNYYSQNVKIGDYYYPTHLSKISSPPKNIFIKGNLTQKLTQNTLGIVGTRSMSKYGEQVLDKLFSELNVANISIVSGFMYGVDAYAHKKAIEYNFHTVAVMPCGIDIVHPVEQTPLYDKLLQIGGWVLSEFPGSAKPKIWSFPKRNRIIAGMSKILIVIEAGFRSGAIITANFSHKFGREVYAVPGSIFNKVSFGCNKLIGEYAIPLHDVNQINEYYDKLIQNDGSEYEQILKLIPKNGIYKNKIYENSDIPVYKLNQLLSEMLIKGIIAEVGGRLCDNRN